MIHLLQLIFHNCVAHAQLSSVSSIAGASGSMGLGTALGVGIGGSILGDAINVFGTQATNTQSQEAQVQAEQFDETMSDTQYQRGVTDLKAAGLNPILAAGGMQTSSPTAPMPSFTAPQVQTPDIMNMALQMKSLDQKDAQIAIDRANSASSIAKNLSDTQLNRMKTVLAQRGLIPAELEGQGAQLVQKFIQGVKNQYNNPDPKQIPSSGGSTPGSDADWNKDPVLP